MFTQLPNWNYKTNTNNTAHLSTGEQIQQIKFPK